MTKPSSVRTLFNVLVLLICSINTPACAQYHSVPTQTITGYELARPSSRTKQQIIYHLGYTTSYNPEWLQPNWVAWELTQEEADGKQKRGGQFAPDPRVKSKYSAQPSDYRQSGYDRGHMAPAGDMKWDSDAMEETFLLSNICPQKNELNAGLWERLETRCRSWARFHGKVWICCGPIIEKRHKTIGENKVAVPSAFFKVVCLEHKGQYQAVGFVFANEACEGNIWDYAMSVDEVEELTGIDFFYLLPDNIEDQMEAHWDQRRWSN